MEELLKDNDLLIIICLSVISLILIIVTAVDQFIIKKEMADEIRSLNKELNNWKSWYDKSVRSYQNQNRGVQVQQMQCRGNSAQHQQGHIRVRNNSISSIAASTTNENTILENILIEKGSHAKDSQKQTIYQYLQEAFNGKFMKTLSSPEKCYFRTWAEGGVRKYEFCGNVAKALANINAIFDDVCEIEGKRSGATDIENVSAGTLDSELRITSKAKIRLK